MVEALWLEYEGPRGSWVSAASDNGSGYSSQASAMFSVQCFEKKYRPLNNVSVPSPKQDPVEKKK